MRLKHKKSVVLIAIGALFLSFLLFSALPNGSKKGASTTESILQESNNEQINILVGKYFSARQTGDLEIMSELFTDPSAIDKTKLNLLRNYIEEYKNIKCHLIENEKKDAYCVYVQYEIKLFNIVTPAPSLTVLYITQGSDGDYKIFNSPQDESIRKFIEASDKNIEIIKLKNRIEKEYEEVRKNDPDLNEFSNMLQQQTNAATGSAVE